MSTIYISQTRKNAYRKITLDPDSKRNIGCIEKNGCLNAKPKLRNMISNAGGDFTAERGFTGAKNGSTHGVGGCGYDSYAIYKDAETAIFYLKKYFKCHLSE